MGIQQDTINKTRYTFLVDKSKDTIDHEEIHSEMQISMLSISHAWILSFCYDFHGTYLFLNFKRGNFCSENIGSFFYHLFLYKMNLA